MSNLEPDPSVTALRDEVRGLFHEAHQAMRVVVAGLTAGDLDWRPVDGANSITVLVNHALDAERFLVAAAADTVIDRDREAMFLIRGSDAAGLIALVDRVEAEVDGYLDRLRPDLLTATLTRGHRVHQGAWWLLHPLEHSREHVGQALLTRQLLDAERPRAS